MTDLIQRLTDATGNERGLFEEAWNLIHHYGYGPENERDTCRLCDRFTAMLDAEAWTGAAEMLVPEGCLYMARTVWDDANAPTERAVGYASIDRYFRDDGGLMWKENSLALGATPALALLIAALKAHGGNDAE